MASKAEEAHLPSDYESRYRWLLCLLSHRFGVRRGIGHSQCLSQVLDSVDGREKRSPRSRFQEGISAIPGSISVMRLGKRDAKSNASPDILKR